MLPDALHSALCVTDVNLSLRLSKVMMSAAPEIVSNALRLMEILTACDHGNISCVIVIINVII